MKLGILIPLKAKNVSRNWSVTCECLRKTLHSIERQTSSNWEAVVVGHDEPELFTEAPYKTEFATIDITPPVPPEHAYTKVDYEWIRDRARDRNSKIVHGMQLLQGKGVDYWYYLDADDLLHRQFVEKLSGMDLMAGATLHEGYLWYPKNRRVMPYTDMPEICGSTAIIRASDFEVPDDLSLEKVYTVPYCRFNHTEIARYFIEEHDSQYVAVPDRLLAYSVGHGDNTSDGFRDTPIKRIKAWAKPYVLGRRAGKTFLNDFSIQ